MILKVQYAKEWVAVEVASPSACVKELKAVVEQATQVSALKQKLIYKGKVLENGNTLDSYKIGDNSKLMLLTGGVEREGAQRAAQQRVAEQHARAARQAERFAADRAERSARAQHQADEREGLLRPTAEQLARRVQRWRNTGIVSLGGLALDTLPPGLSDLGGTIRSVDVGDNALTTLPDDFLALQGLERLRASGNGLADDGVPWATLALLPRLHTLLLARNALRALPGVIGVAARLRVLDLSHNALAALPSELGALPALELLSVRGNALTALPPELGNCPRLENLDASVNRLTAVPPELGRLTALKALRLDGNSIAAVPEELLRGASQLQCLVLRGNPITAEALREVPGWEAYSRRRRARLDKAVEMRVGADFDEGVDYETFFKQP